MKKRSLISLLIVLVYVLKFQAQFSFPPQHIDFNTGNDFMTGCQTMVGATDDVWKVSINNGPYTSAIKVPWVVGWAGENSGCTNNDYGWIAPNFGCANGPSNHSCFNSGLTVDLFFAVTFNLPINPILVLDWQVAADDQVMGIYINGPLVFTPPAGNHKNNPFSFRWCSGWKQGSNTIIIHVRSTPAAAPNRAGLQVISWAVPVFQPMTTVGSPTVCNNTSNTTYSVTQQVPGTSSYSWSFTPPTWNGISSLPSMNPSFGTSSVVLNTYAMSPGGCIGATTLAIDVITPTLMITPSAAAVCPGYPVTLTAGGAGAAATYSWISPIPIPQRTLNPVTANPMTTTQYSVIGWDAQGCKSGTTITIGMLPVPTISVSASPSIICTGVTNTLTATGAVNYTWLPSGPVVAPPMANTTYSVIGGAVNGCTNIAVITLTPGVTIPLTASNPTICTDISSCTTASASTNFTPVIWSWAPIQANQSSLTVCPVVNTTYTATANSSAGCSNSITVAVTLQTCCPPPDPAIAFVIPNNPLCNLTLTNLAQYVYSITPGGSQIPMTGTFSGTGVTAVGGSQYTFNQFQSLSYGIYTIAFTYTTAPWGCPYTLYQTATVLPPLMVYALPAYRCAYSPIGVGIWGGVLPNQPAPFYPWAYPITYSWSPGGMAGQSQTVSPTVNTVYTITASSAGCIGSATMMVAMVNTCCPQSSVTPVLSLTTLTATVGNGPVLSGPIIIDQDLTITGAGNYRFSGGDFIINENVKIIVDPNVNLMLGDAHLYACNQMWQGIVVKNGGSVFSGVNPASGLTTMIEDAHIAIDVENIATGHAMPVLNLDGVIFNKNWFGISIHNSTLTTIPISMRACVFTSRDLPTGTMLWPSSSSNPGGLRYASAGSIASSLSPPFLLSNYPIMLPTIAAGLPWGITITNIGNVNGAVPSAGVDFTSSAPIVASEFNLFDYLQVGIALNDASMTTYNNTFQNMGICGISSTISTTMNARLSLTSPQQSTGNRFWNNYWNAGIYWGGNYYPNGIWANNVFELDVENAIFRGFSIQTGGSGTGILINSNRFNNYRVRYNTFSNLPSGISMNFSPGPFNINGPSNGIYAGSMDISNNFFGPQVNAIAPITSNEDLGGAIGMYAPNMVSWSIPGINQQWNVTQPNFIQNNIIDRASNGIYIEGMGRYPLGIISNTIDMAPTNGTGIYLAGTFGHKAIRNNRITAMSFSSYNSQAALVRSTGNYSPAITCNTVTGGYTGFDFLADNSGTTWTGNIMEDNVIGLHIGNIINGQGTFPGAIGQQGAPGYSSGNRWLGPWGGSTFETAVDFPSTPSNSHLYVANLPLNNAGVNPYSTVGPFPTLFLESGAYGCPSPTTLERTSNDNNVTGIYELSTYEEGNIKLYPNPTSGNITITSEKESEALQVIVVDITGKMVYSKIVITENHNSSINLPFEQGIYMINIQDENYRKSHKKLVINRE
jgi:hypothetical protein